MPSSTLPSPHSDDSWIGLRTLRRYTEGTLVFSQRRTPVRFVIDPATGRLVMPLEPAALESHEHVLHLPAETGCVLSVLLIVKELENPAGHESPDRWMAYHSMHGQPIGRWVTASIEAAKHETMVFPGEEITQPNILRACEPRLIRSINEQRQLLSQACRCRLGVNAVDPLCVGVDMLGVDVRIRFGVLRLEFASPAMDEPAAQTQIRDLLSD